MYKLSFICKGGRIKEYTGWREPQYFEGYPTKDDIRVQFIKIFKKYLVDGNTQHFLYHILDPKNFSISEKGGWFYLLNIPETKKCGVPTYFGWVEFSIKKVDSKENLESFLTDDFSCIRKFVKDIMKFKGDSQ